MKRKRFSEAQIIVTRSRKKQDLCRKHGITEQFVQSTGACGCQL